jgi:uncharacterized protein (DUF2147 family)
MATFCGITATLSGAESILGQWRTEGGKSMVEITSKEGTLRGTIVWLKEPAYTDAKEGTVGSNKIDRHNPQPSQRTQPILGLKILDGFIATGDGLWEKGTIYDPENGKTYKCKMKLVAPNHLEVRGFIGISIIGRTTVWTR